MQVVAQCGAIPESKHGYQRSNRVNMSAANNAKSIGSGMVTNYETATSFAGNSIRSSKVNLYRQFDLPSSSQLSSKGANRFDRLTAASHTAASASYKFGAPTGAAKPSSSSFVTSAK